MAVPGGILFNYRLSFGLVTALYGFEKGILTAEMLNLLLLCVLFSSLVAAILEKRLGSSTNEWSRDSAKHYIRKLFLRNASEAKKDMF